LFKVSKYFFNFNFDSSSCSISNPLVVEIFKLNFSWAQFIKGPHIFVWVSKSFVLSEKKKMVSVSKYRRRSSCTLSIGLLSSEGLSITVQVRDV